MPPQPLTQPYSYRPFNPAGDLTYPPPVLRLFSHRLQPYRRRRLSSAGDHIWPSPSSVRRHTALSPIGAGASVPPAIMRSHVVSALTATLSLTRQPLLEIGTWHIRTSPTSPSLRQTPNLKSVRPELISEMWRGSASCDRVLRRAGAQ